MENLRLEERLQERLEKIEKLIISNKQVLTLEEASEFTGFKSSFLYKLTSSARIPHYKPNGKTIFFNRVELENWLLQNRVKTQQELADEVNSYTLKRK